MFVELIYWILLVVLLHDIITGNFCQDRSCSNGKTQGIAFDNGKLLDRQIGNSQPIDQNDIRGDLQSIDRLAHRTFRCIEDIDFIDDIRCNDTERITQCNISDEFIYFFSF